MLLQDNELVQIKLPSYLEPNSVITSLTNSIIHESSQFLDLNKISPVFFEYSICIAYLAEDEKLYSLLFTMMNQRASFIYDLVYDKATKAKYESKDGFERSINKLNELQKSSTLHTYNESESSISAFASKWTLSELAFFKHLQLVFS